VGRKRVRGDPGLLIPKNNTDMCIVGRVGNDILPNLLDVLIVLVL
jgi:hypothetical protein